ncbi:hypothetical protein [Oceanobacillus senegalensis]|uniref:hypothetical protein n=1 Tax=Oceanobacillus senegalensis TaxID=1936063 RepID=UPI000A30C67D|nr:hypothetical protein [Oceanobacillus senegalensis]
MKFIKAFIFTTILSFLLFPISGMASSLEKLPSSEKSNQWEVVIDKPKSNEHTPKPDVNFYSMDIKYIGDEKVKIERVEAYRDDPNSSFDFEIFTVTPDLETEKDVKSVGHQNFPIFTQATKLKVIVTWTKEGEDSSKYKRNFREEFIFKQ